MNIKELKEMLSKYPDDMIITNEQNNDFVHIINDEDGVILSTNKPIGYCNRTGEYVYPTPTVGYSAFCPKLDEDLYDYEWTPFSKVEQLSRNVDWSLLAKQKLWLVEQSKERNDAQGLLNFIDCLQDFLVENGASEDRIFPTLDKENEDE